MLNRLLCTLMLFGCGAKQEPNAVVAGPIVYSDVAISGVSDAALQTLLHEQWESLMQAYPVWASQLGDHRFDGQLSQISPLDIEARHNATKRLYQRAQSIQSDTLNEDDALTHQLFIHALEDDLATSVCAFWRWSISPRSNAYVQFAGLGEKHVVHTLDDGQNLLSRYRAIPAHVQQQIDNLTRGMNEGNTANQASILLVVKMLDDALNAPLEESPFLAPLQKEHPTWDPAQHDLWRAEMRQVVVDEIVPVFRTYHAFLRDTLAPKGRAASEQGLSSLANGPECYGALVRSYTTLNTDADTLHQRGIDALAGIHEEFRALGPKTLGTDNLREIFVRLRTTPELYFDDETQVVDKAETSLARAKEVMGIGLVAYHRRNVW